MCYNKIMKKYHYIYKITNLITGFYYIGRHSTMNLNDGYMGSGTLLNELFELYGKENFKKEILEFLSDFDALKAREKQIVNRDFLKLPNVLNMNEGGDGGWEHVNNNVELRKAKNRRAGLKMFKKNLKFKGNNMTQEEYELKQKNFMIASNSIEAIEKKKKTFEERQHQQGEKNSQFGSMWISNGLETKKVKNTHPIPEGWHRGRK